MAESAAVGIVDWPYWQKVSKNLLCKLPCQLSTADISGQGLAWIQCKPHAWQLALQLAQGRRACGRCWQHTAQACCVQR